MAQKRRSGGLDIFRIVAAVLVVAIHTSPLTVISVEADFLLTRILARIAVPFFFMVTGQYVLAEAFEGENKRIFPYLKKVAGLYLLAIVLYIPLGIYAGHYKELQFTEALKMLLVDGTFYHLWYFPACITGVLIVYGLSRVVSLNVATVIAVLLYIVGLLGDSYYGLTAKVPVLAAIYNGIFKLSSYTRNGLFFAPLYLLLGVWCRKFPDMKPVKLSREKSISMRLRNIICLLVSFALMTAEGFLLHHGGLQRHDSMYVMLPAVMIFLYNLLLYIDIPQKKRLRELSTWIYIIHPAVIVLVRMAAKVLSPVKFMVDNSIMNFLAVASLSVIIAVPISGAAYKVRSKMQSRNKADHMDYAKDRAWIELDTEALANNVKFLTERLPKNCKLMPAVKAQAYGHGAVLIARELVKLGVDSFCVACVDEAVELRNAGIKGMILILGYTHPQRWESLVRYRLTQTIVDFEYAVRLDAYGRKHGKRLHVHIGVDTGMHRLGVSCENIDDICRIMDMKNIAVDGIFTHLSADDSMTQRCVNFTGGQVCAFENMKDMLKERRYRVPKTHLSASYGLLNYPELAGDYARIGIALYGVLSTAEDEKEWADKLFPVLSLKARVASVREIDKGESVGYGMGFTAVKSMRIATLSVGYADGIPRELSLRGGYVLINGKKANIIGRICMDQTMVDVSGIENVRSGNEAVFIGRSGEEYIRASETADRIGTISNELLSRLGVRLRRITV